MYASFLDFPFDDNQSTSVQNNQPFNQKSSKLGISFGQMTEVLKTLGLFPSIVAKQELQSIFVQSLTMYDTLTFNDFLYTMFLLFVID